MEITTHTFNPNLNRLEPISKKCVFCEHGRIENTNQCFLVPLYQVADRTDIIVYSSVKYKQVVIGLPLCESCEKIRSKSKIIANITSIVIGIIFISIFINFIEIKVVAGISFILGIIVPIVSSDLITDYLLPKQGSTIVSKAVAADKTIQDFLLMGWSLTPPQA